MSLFTECVLPYRTFTFHFTTVTAKIKDMLRSLFYDVPCAVTMGVDKWFVWSFTPPSRIFYSYGDVTITGEGLQILTYAGHSRSLSSECSLACPQNIRVLWSSPRTHNTHTYYLAFSNEAVTICFHDLGMSWLRF